MSEKDFDLICIGRSCVDLYSGEFGVPLERAMAFTKSVGGSPMNIAIGTSRLGLRVGAITGVGQEDNGRYLKWQLSCEGVDVSAVKTDPKRLTAMVLLSIRGDNDFPLIQYRENCADMGLTAEDIDPDYLARAGAVLVTGTHLSREGVRSATMKVLETAKRLGLKCILDIDFRPNLWGLQGARRRVQPLGRGVRAGDLRIQESPSVLRPYCGYGGGILHRGRQDRGDGSPARSPQALEGAPRLQARGQGLRRAARGYSGQLRG